MVCGLGTILDGGCNPREQYEAFPAASHMSITLDWLERRIPICSPHLSTIATAEQSTQERTPNERHQVQINTSLGAATSSQGNLPSFLSDGSPRTGYSRGSFAVSRNRITVMRRSQEMGNSDPHWKRSRLNRCQCCTIFVLSLNLTFAYTQVNHGEYRLATSELVFGYLSKHLLRFHRVSSRRSET